MNRITLEGKLRFATALIAVLTLILTASALVPTYGSYRSAQENLHAIERFRLVLEAANRISAERGPANDIMSIEPNSSTAAKERLQQFRAMSDNALATLETPVDASVDPGDRLALDKLLSNVKEQLQLARENVDRIGATPLSIRRVEDVQHAIGDMIATVDIFQNVIDWHVAFFTTRQPALIAPLVTGRMISDLREYGGRIASQILGPIAMRQPLQESHQADASQTMGRLLELRRLLQGQTMMARGDPQATGLMSEIDTVFFGTGLGLIKTMIAEGEHSGDYSMSSVELTRRYVPTLQPLEKLRAAFLDQIVKIYAAQHDEAHSHLVRIGATTLGVLVVLVLLSRSIRALLLAPLMTARRQIISLADGTGMTGMATTSSPAEIRSLFEALALLQAKLQERAEYEAQLKMQAEKDGLTSVWNRRALEGFGHSPSLGEDDGICLMLIDIDHFKNINDTYGHLTGDAVLVEIAALLEASMRSSDIVARFGGEEFAVLVSHRDLLATFAFAEKLRRLIQSHVIRHADMNVDLNITASIGVAVGKRGPDSWRQLIAAADDALYRAKNQGRNRTCLFGDGMDQARLNDPQSRGADYPPSVPRARMQ